MKARSLWFRTQLRRNSNATKMQPLAAHVFIRCHTRGEELFSLHKKTGALNQSGVWRSGFCMSQLEEPQARLFYFFCTMLESKHKSSQGRLVTIPHSIHNMLATQIAGRTGYLALQ